LVARSPPGIGSRRSQGSPRFLGGPQCVHALGGYPGGPSTPGHSATRMLPSARSTTSAPQSVVSRGWLPRPAHSLSTLRNGGLPRRYARLASGGWPTLAGQDLDLLGLLRRVSGSVYCMSLPPFPGLAWREERLYGFASEEPSPGRRSRATFRRVVSPPARPATSLPSPAMVQTGKPGPFRLREAIP